MPDTPNETRSTTSFWHIDVVGGRPHQQWRQTPKEFAPFTTVQGYFYRFCREGTFDRINHVLVMQAREIAGREASPTAGVNDSQSVKTTEAGGSRGFDAQR